MTRFAHVVGSLAAVLVLAALALGVAWSAQGDAPEPTARALIGRHEKEKSPVWSDGDTATFFFRGEADQVKLMVGGEELAFRRLPDSDVWVAKLTKPGLAKGVLTYHIMPGKQGEAAHELRQKGQIRRWRGPQAPPAPARVEDWKDLKGQIKPIDFDSQALGGKRGVRVYLPPGHERTKSYPVVYATDGGYTAANLVEPLILSGKIPPLIVVGVTSGEYHGDRSAAFDIKKDLRSAEYLPGVDPERYAKHETFFCQELPTWAEREFGASRDRRERAVFGCSSGGRFAADMGGRHPDHFGHVFAFSIAGRTKFTAPEKADGLPHFHLAAGTWETSYHKMTAEAAEALKKQGAPVTFVSRVAGHDLTMWEDELVAALLRAWGAAR